MSPQLHGVQPGKILVLREIFPREDVPGNELDEEIGHCLTLHGSRAGGQRHCIQYLQ